MVGRCGGGRGRDLCGAVGRSARGLERLRLAIRTRARARAYTHTHTRAHTDTRERYLKNWKMWTMALNRRSNCAVRSGREEGVRGVSVRSASRRRRARFGRGQFARAATATVCHALARQAETVTAAWRAPSRVSFGSPWLHGHSSASVSPGPLQGALYRAQQCPPHSPP